ncbi:hypothetical protein ACFS5N_02645 [Mucilaginibacter ximonensis]|uniref:Uncharacterized protein n=1 Tax=Mucilaginibacter ximonensis TaxID=538021 RepID=A0ABW5Y7W0_9SPHI
MKNILKISLAAIVVAMSLMACGDGHKATNAVSQPDTTKVDSDKADLTKVDSNKLDTSAKDGTAVKKATVKK